jgi:nucleotide-binding universal stress UspA family protein
MSIFPTKILLASDGSEDAAVAVRAAVDISGKSGSELHVVHAWKASVPPGYTGRPLPTTYSLEYERATRDLLTGQVKRIEAAGGMVAEAHLREGRTVDEILDLSEELHAGLIVVGRRGLSPLKSLIMGSVSDGLVRRATRPVLVVSGSERNWPPTRIVIGEDFSEEAKGAAKLAAALGKLFNAEGLLVLAYPEFPDIPQELAHHPDTPAVEEDLRRAETILEEVSRELEEDLGWRPRTRVVVGNAAAVVVEAATEGDGPALIAVGSRGLGKMERLRLGSVSSAVLRAASGPVLVYRQPH